MERKSTRSNNFIHSINQCTVLCVNKADLLLNEFSASRPTSLQMSGEVL